MSECYVIERCVRTVTQWSDLCMEGCALGTGQSISVNQAGSETKWQLEFLNTPWRATV